MHSIATCPLCAAQLALPPAATASDYAVCPECKAEFSLADADQRWLATAELIPPPEVAEPEPATTVEDEVSEPVVQPDISSQQTIELKEPIASPAAEAIEADVPEPAELKLQEPEQVSLDDLMPNPRTTETLVSTSSLSDWESRLRSAIDGPEEQEEESTPEHEAASRERTPLEDAPEFDFHMDPPAEKPEGPEEIPAEELSKTAEWFQNAPAEHVEPTEPEVAEPTHETPRPQAEHAEPVAVASDPQPLKKHRKKNSLLRVTAVFTLFGVLGLVAGQYVLLWLRGPSADYMGLASVVPRSMLPSPTSQILAPQIAPEEALASRSEAIEPEAVGNELLADHSAPLETKIEPIIEDTSVVNASAELPVQPNEAEKQPLVLLPPSTITSGEFSDLVDAARQSLPGFLQADLSTTDSKKLKGQSFMTFCRLAERFDYAQRSTSFAADASLADSARSLFRTIAADEGAKNDLAYIAKTWWGYTKRPNSGMVVIGRIESVQPQPGFNIYELSLEGSEPGQTIPVVVANADFRVGDTLGIAGTIVPDPRRSLPDFSLDLPQVVVSHFEFGHTNR